MTIEKTEVKKDGYHVFIDGNEFVIDEEIAYSYRLRKNGEIDENTLGEIVQKSECLRCKNYLYAQIAKYYKTEKGYRDKLYEKGFPSYAVKSAILSAKERGYIDDSSFAKRYYEKYKDVKGKRRIIAELKSKGVKSEYLDFMSEEETDLSSIVSVGEKFMRRREKTPEEKLRLMRHLASKGFSYDEIVRAVKIVFSSDE